MNTLICNAIKNRQRLKFRYHDKTRVVEPQCYGIGTTGKELLRAYVVEGDVEKNNKLFVVSELSSIVLLNQFFKSPGPNYRKGDSAMKTIFKEL